jgi:AbrB family looped-hinge helix DNA binding protein
MTRAIINGMQIKVDKAGRIVLPKKVRERFRLRAGAKLELKESSQGLVLRPVGQGPSLVQKNGIWVHLGKASHDFAWDRIVEDLRDERMKDLAGL